MQPCKEDAPSGFVRFILPMRVMKGRIQLGKYSQHAVIGEVVIEIDLQKLAEEYGPNVLRSRNQHKRLLRGLVAIKGRNVTKE